MDVRLVALLLTGLAFAGCSDEAPAPVEDEQGLDLEYTATTGVIRGVVLDAAISPLANVAVQVVGAPLNTTTDAEGRFGFASMQPGTYFLEFRKPGYEGVQQSAEVVAGVASPPIVKVQMLRLPGTEPYVIPMQWDGFMACSWFLVIAFATGCLIGEYIADDSRNYEDIDGRPDWLQSEVDWEHTQPAGENLCLRQYASSGIGGDILGDVCGPSPLLMQIGADQLEETGVGNTRGLERVVWVDFWLADNTAGVAIDQDFTVFTHRFYNFVPDPAWMFLTDGAPVPPS